MTTEELLKEILEELRRQNRTLELLFNLTAKMAKPCGEKETPKVPPEYIETMDMLMAMTKGSPFEKPLSKMVERMKEKEKTDGH